MYVGMPAVPRNEWRRSVAETRRLADLRQQVQAIEARLARFAAKLSDADCD